MIIGPSGSGKSALALQLMAFGCDLVSDDQTLLAARDDMLWASAPATIRDRIEARGVGVLAAMAASGARVVVVIDLGKTESERLPPERLREFCGLTIPVVHKIDAEHFPAALLHYMKAGRVA